MEQNKTCCPKCFHKCTCPSSKESCQGGWCIKYENCECHKPLSSEPSQECKGEVEIYKENLKKILELKIGHYAVGHDKGNKCSGCLAEELLVTLGFRNIESKPLSSEPSQECPFCPMFDNKTGDIIDIEPLNPVIKGHRIIIPREHVKDFSDKPEVTARVMEYASHLAKTWGNDCNLITSKGRSATQSVFHLHVHLVPRTENDGLKLPWSGQIQPTEVPQEGWREVLDIEFPYYPEEPMYGSENIIERDRLKNFIARLLKEAEQKGYERGKQETTKAFGSCKKCYGKGYSTTIQHYEGHGEFDMGTGDVHVFGKMPLENPCSCDRGQQIKNLIKSAEIEGKIQAQAQLCKAIEEIESYKKVGHDMEYEDGFNQGLDKALAILSKLTE